jgi:hypothetical protein
VATKEQQDESAVHGVTFPHGVLAGDVATVLHYVADRFHREVEQLVSGTCWGWFVKVIEGSSSISNHASGTAIDLNADQHPMGVAAAKTFTAAQIRACHAIVAACAGVVRWGGDYTGRPDPMHWEIVGNRAEVRALAKQIREDDMPTVDEIATAVGQQLDARLDDIAKAVNATYKVPGSNVPGDAYLRSHDQLAKDLWLAAFVGTMGGGNAIPAAGALGQLLAAAETGVDPVAIATRIAAALPPDLARQTAVELLDLIAAARPAS